ncbi:MAG: RluA family pseudouridine synthase [Betaproteobacteria bacterium]|nr:RluA family pseudouridine synthase [Betaproteobacteria bacterium]
MRILYGDDSLLALDKPAGLLSVPGRGEDKQDCLSARIQAGYPDALIVHRLDQATSGLLLMARGEVMQRALSRDFAARRVHKRYIAVVDGRLAAPGDATEDWGVIDLPLAADWPRRPRQRVDAAHGKPSLTRWRVLGREGDNATRVELEPVTGRTHQLRVHLAALGHPILGDALYAPDIVQARSGRLLLHASRLELTHPASGQPLLLQSAAPF